MKALMILKLIPVTVLAIMAVATAIAGCDLWTTVALTSAAGVWARVLTA
jgi:hypothetical protein